MEDNEALTGCRKANKRSRSCKVFRQGSGFITSSTKQHVVAQHQDLLSLLISLRVHVGNHVLSTA